VNEPRPKSFDVPSSAVWSAGALTIGATFATLTVKVLESLPPSFSVTLTMTVYAPLSA
jgi:hypothetical protein